MDEMWKMLMYHKLTPNEFYLLWSMREKTSAPFINESLELRSLKKKGWVIEDVKLTSKALRVIKEVEGYFKKRKSKSNAVIMGDDFMEKIEQYNNLFPKMKLPTGSAARANKKNLEPAFRWFFENYEYDWDQVIFATKKYLDEKEKENWQFTKTSQYFIRKQNTDKTWMSSLADYCQFVEDGIDDDTDRHFTEKVF